MFHFSQPTHSLGLQVNMALSLSYCTSIYLHNQVKVSHNFSTKKCLQTVKKLVHSTGVPSILTPPQESLQKGNWVKLICGASFEDVVDIRNLSLVYTLAGAFDPLDCPLDCSRPCEAVCPADAIVLRKEDALEGGVINERCYGCGRCLPVCPYDKIKAITYLRDAVTAAQLVRRNDVDAIEIHTNGRQTVSFEEFWNEMGDSVSHLKLIAISLPDVGKATTTLMSTMFSIMRPNLSCYNLWQLDGRPMSGDIGRGATREVLAYAVRLAATEDRPPGFLQLAGGTNAHTVNGLKEKGLFQIRRNLEDGILAEQMSGSCNSLISGIAYGGYARKIVGRILRSMQSQHGLAYIEDYPVYLSEALREALALVGSVKCYAQLGIDQK
ncbi:uncharacterized protein LOC104888450 isoform X2 [Beta vulgaris subsp. vulgaris]|uniref:uncharacterized protein LOC104888450 isoform X2 n=1 Tax=Beta vulgaris subsp. vulgaris TaxID=3555 RepID=UPI00203702FB|nr:uncharacterized protein LOC104888450 isoform X2 [Beta vulgaris subsp. vulgaris]